MRMISTHRLARTMAAALTLAWISTSGSGAARAEEPQWHSTTYEVTITNLTRDQRFTPILVVTHNQQVGLFELGAPASTELESVAEEGNISPLMTSLSGTRGVFDMAASSGLLEPGASVTIEVRAGFNFKYLSLASMLIPTNDGFIALNGAALPALRREETYTSPVYDAGTERNDETCASIPGPFFDECGGPGSGGAPAGQEEGYVSIHSGIHGIGDIDPARRDWRNPAAKITVRRTR